MQTNDETFFENIAAGKGGDVNETGNYEVELAKAETSAVASRSTKTARAKAEDWDAAEPEGQLTVDVYQTADDIVIEFPPRQRNRTLLKHTLVAGDN